MNHWPGKTEGSSMRVMSHNWRDICHFQWRLSKCASFPLLRNISHFESKIKCVWTGRKTKEREKERATTRFVGSQPSNIYLWWNEQSRQDPTEVAHKIQRKQKISKSLSHILIRFYLGTHDCVSVNTVWQPSNEAMAWAWLWGWAWEFHLPWIRDRTSLLARASY